MMSISEGLNFTENCLRHHTRWIVDRRILFAFSVKRPQEGKKKGGLGKRVTVRLLRRLIVSYQLPGRTCDSIVDSIHSLVQLTAASRSTPAPPPSAPECRPHTAALRAFVCLAVTSHCTPISQHLQRGVSCRAMPAFHYTWADVCEH